MSDYLERVEAFLNNMFTPDGKGDVIRAYSSGGVQHLLTDADLRALLADAKQLRELRPEYGIDADFASTRSATFTVADTLGDALKALEEFDAKRGDVVSRQLVERPVGEWRKVGDPR